MLALLKNQTVILDGIECSVVSGSAHSDTLLENKVTGERARFSSSDLIAKYMSGDLLTDPSRRCISAAAKQPRRKPARMDGMSEVAKKETHRRLDYMVRLEREGAFDGARKQLREAINRISAARGELRAPHESTIYRWRRRYLQAKCDVRALFVQFDAQGGEGQSRLQRACPIFCV